jgi:hypothetical protein
MTLDDLIAMTENRISTLNSARVNAYLAGDVAAVNTIDADIMQTTVTLDQLRVLKQATNG